MIRLLTGTVVETTPHAITLDIHGVGYRVHTDAFRYGYPPGTLLTLHTYLAVRETALELYGFRDAATLSLFEHLLSVPKIGPKSALQVLCHAEPGTLVTAISAGEPGTLAATPGIGKKTAEQIVSTLRDTLSSEVGRYATNPPSTGEHTDAIDALVALGFSRDAAREAARRAPADADTASIVRAALREERFE